MMVNVIITKVGESLFDTCWKRWMSEIHPEEGFVQQVYDKVENYEATFDGRMGMGDSPDPYRIFTHMVGVWYDWWLEEGKYREGTKADVSLGNINNTGRGILPF